MARRFARALFQRLPAPDSYQDWRAWARSLIDQLELANQEEGFIWYGVAAHAVNGFENSWSELSSNTPVEFRIDSEGAVWIRGIATKVTPSPPDTIFTLPEGFRPRYALGFGSPGSLAYSVLPSGEVQRTAGTASDAVLDEVVFNADG